MSTTIEFRSICKSYGDKSVLDGFNLSVEKGEFVTIIGSSGCGKTTVLKLVNGLLKPDSGKILIVGEDISEALKLGTKVLVMDAGKIEQYATPEELLRVPATDFVRRLVEKERRACRLPEERLIDCEYSGVRRAGMQAE